MKLLESLLEQCGFEDSETFRVDPSRGAYFKNVKHIAEYSPQRIVLALAKRGVTVEGENMQISGYFQRDIFIRGKVTGVRVE